MFKTLLYFIVSDIFDIRKNTSSMYTTIIADGHPIFRTSTRKILNGLKNIKLLGESSTGIDAYQLIIATHPQIAILDLEMPVLTGLEVCTKVLNEKKIHNLLY